MRNHDHLHHHADAGRALHGLLTTLFTTGVGVTHVLLHWPYYTAARARRPRP